MLSVGATTDPSTRLLPINKAARLSDDGFNAGCTPRANLRDAAPAAVSTDGVDDDRNPDGADASKLSHNTRGAEATPPLVAHEVRSRAPGRSPTTRSTARRSMVRWRRPYLRTVGHCAALAAHKFTECLESGSRATP